MKTLKLTDKDFKDVDGFKEYMGTENLQNFDGNIEVEAGVGHIRVTSIKVSGYLWIKAGYSIKAGDSIKAGNWIEAGDSIEAGDWIKAGDSIKAIRGGINAGLSITCKGLLKFKLKLFAGISPYSWNENCSKTVTCGKLDGNVVYGTVIETGLNKDVTVEKETIELNGKKYQLVEEEQP